MLWHPRAMLSRERLARSSRIVIKVGTQVVTHEGGFALGRISSILEDIATLRAAGREVMLVSSGAVGLGARALDRPRPTSLGMRQAFAAVGQGRLTGLYDQLFGAMGIKSAQVLLSQDDLGDPDRALCLRTTLLRLLELQVVPILNENDSVSVRELTQHPSPSGPDAPLSFGDNDGLSAHVASALGADLLVILTDVDGMYTRNPSEDLSASKISQIEEIDASLIARCSGGSAGGTGGMASKLKAAATATARGVDVIIASGMEPGTVGSIIRGDDVGTWIVTPSPASDRRRRIVLGGEADGVIVINDGAIEALERNKASLLPVGVVSVEGEFSQGSLVELRDSHGRVRGRGLTNYDGDACRRIAGLQSEDITACLGWKGYDALITRDNLVMGER